MTAKLDLVRAYLAAYAARDLAAVEATLADAVTLRDWKIRVAGKAAALAETRKNFASVDSLAIEVLAAYEREHGAAAELAIVVNGRDTLYVVDVFDFDAEGRITAIRAYLGRGEED
jgi:ketosteroid isomerase-like protein